MPFSKGDIVLVPFQFTNQGGVKWRPAVIVSSNSYNHGPDVMVASITSNLNALPFQGDHIVANWQGAGLLAPSLAQTKVATIEAALVGRKLGSFGAADLAAFDLGLKAAFDLA